MHNMLNRGVSQAIFEGFFIQRWNDRIRTVNLVEADIHSSKLMLSLFFATKMEESGKEINWTKIVDYGVYGALIKYATSDISSYIYGMLKENRDVYNPAIQKILETAYSDLLPEKFLKNLISFAQDSGGECESTEYQILNLSHKHALSMEIKIIKSLGYGSFFLDHEEPETRTESDIQRLHDALGLNNCINDEHHDSSELVLLKKLVDRLRYQVRWSQTPRIPQTSVLGHSLYVAMSSYFLLRNRYSEARVVNNFYACLMHDFLESLTRDIISPVKSSSDDFAKEISRIEKMILNDHLLVNFTGLYHSKLQSLLTDEFDDRSIKDPSIKDWDGIPDTDKIDGVVVLGLDYYAALLEAHQSIDLGISSHHLAGAIARIYSRFTSKKPQFKDADVYEDILKLYDSYISR